MSMEDSYIYRFLTTYIELPHENGFGTKTTQHSMLHLKMGKKTVMQTISLVSFYRSKEMPCEYTCGPCIGNADEAHVFSSDNPIEVLKWFISALSPYIYGPFGY